MSNGRRKYTAEFKREAVALSNHSDRTAVSVAHELGIAPQLLYKWRAAARQCSGAAFSGSGKLHEADELTRLRQELALVQRERDILKKALAIFSRSP